MTSFTLLKIALLHNVHSILETVAKHTKGHETLFLTSYTRKVKKKHKNKLFDIYAFLMLDLKGIRKKTITTLNQGWVLSNEGILLLSLLIFKTLMLFSTYLNIFENSFECIL